MKVKERIFKDMTGDNLIVQHRKSAVIFLRETDVTLEGWVSPFWQDPTPAIKSSELERIYQFSDEVMKELFEYLCEISHEAWKDFLLKEEDCLGADYREYYDRKLQNNGYLSLKDKDITIRGPLQDKTDEAVVRLYQFSKRKLESFLYDFQENIS